MLRVTDEAGGERLLKLTFARQAQPLMLCFQQARVATRSLSQSSEGGYWEAERSRYRHLFLS
jgi:hypothetical protein